MPPRQLSRHRYTRGVRSSSGVLTLTLAAPFRFVDRLDNITLLISEGDSLFTLAGRLYQPIDPARSCGLWWILADYQPEPIFDPTLALEVGSTLYAPSVRTVLEEIFSETRRGAT